MIWHRMLGVERLLEPGQAAERDAAGVGVFCPLGRDQQRLNPKYRFFRRLEGGYDRPKVLRQSRGHGRVLSEHQARIRRMRCDGRPSTGWKNGANGAKNTGSSSKASTRASSPGSRSTSGGSRDSHNDG